MAELRKSSGLLRATIIKSLRIDLEFVVDSLSTKKNIYNNILIKAIKA